MSTQENILHKATGSLKWSALMEIMSRTASPIIMIILVRFLTPADFGVVATAMITISFSQMFWDAGLSKALIQREEAPTEAANVVFWTNLILGLIIYVLLFVMAPWVAVFFKSHESGPVLRVLGLQIVIASLSSVQQALFVRELDFRRLFWIKLSTAFVPGFFSIPLAFYGYGVWALVGGTLAGQTLNLILLWHNSTWRPSIQYDLLTARKMFRFGVWVFGESLLGWFYIWADSMILGVYLGVRDLGLYRTGASLVMLAFGFFLNPFLPVLYPAFSRLQNNRDQLKRVFSKAFRIIIAIALPMSAGLFLLGGQIADVLFGDKWVGLGQVIAFLALVQGWSWFATGCNFEAYRAMGRPDVFTKLMAFALLYYLPVYFFAAPRGLEVFLWARLFVSLISLPIHIWLMVRILGLSPLFLWNQSRHSWVAVGMMGLVVFIIKSLIEFCHFEWAKQGTVLGLLVMLGAATYIVVLAILDWNYVRDVKMMALKAMRC